MIYQYDCLTKYQLVHTEMLLGPVINLKLLKFYEQNDLVSLAYYDYQIIKSNQVIGKITLKLGINSDIYIDGHVGYQIADEFQGHHYAYYALELIKTLAKAHGYQNILISTEPANEKSIKTIYRAGGKLILANQKVPKNHIYYVIGKQEIHVFEVAL